MAANHESSLTALATSNAQEMRVMAAEIRRHVNTVANMAPPTPPVVPSPLVPLPSFPGPAPEPRVGAPERYAGDPEGYNAFITNCSILFALQPSTFASEEAKVSSMINHLMGKVR